jgi:hypothetical protein
VPENLEQKSWKSLENYAESLIISVKYGNKFHKLAIRKLPEY